MTLKLAQLAGKRFPDINFSLAEVTLLDRITRGEKVFGRELPLSKGRKKQHERDSIVHACLLRWLCVDKDANVYVDSKGVLLHDIKVKGVFDLEDTTVPFPIALQQCQIEEGIILRDARTRSLGLNNCKVGHISADRVKVDGIFYLSDGFRAMQGVNLNSARIEGNLVLDGARLLGKDNSALSLSMAKIAGSLYLGNGFRAHGAVLLDGANIQGNLSCKGGFFLHNVNQHLKLTPL